MTNNDLLKAVKDFLGHEDDPNYVRDLSDDPIILDFDKNCVRKIIKLSHQEIVYLHGQKGTAAPLDTIVGSFFIEQIVQGLKQRSQREQAIKENLPENSGGACSYYRVHIPLPLSKDANEPQEAYIAECGDIIEALNMDWNEANEFKAIWRTAAARTLNKRKDGNNAKRDTEKRVFFANRSMQLLNNNN